MLSGLVKGWGLQGGARGHGLAVVMVGSSGAVEGVTPERETGGVLSREEAVAHVADADLACAGAGRAGATGGRRVSVGELDRLLWRRSRWGRLGGQIDVGEVGA